MKAAAIAAIALGNAFIFANNNQLTGVTASGGTKQAPSFKGGGGGGKHDQEMQEDKEYAQFQQQMAQQQLDRDQVTDNAEYQMGHITKQQLIADEIDFENLVSSKALIQILMILATLFPLIFSFESEIFFLVQMIATQC